jgi:low temperature requirement protein LtrA
MTRFTLFGAGLMMLVVGTLHLLAPQMMMKEPGIALETVNHLHVVRAAYGGAYLGIAALFLAGVFRVVDTRASLSAVAIIFGGFALGRLVSLVADGLPVPLYLGVLGAELFFATCAVLALRDAPAAGARGGH